MNSSARWPLSIYVGAIVALAVVGAALTQSTEDASIGGALLLGIVALLGLPWSAAMFLADDGLDGNAISVAVYAASAILNALLVLCVARVVLRRRRQ